MSEDEMNFEDLQGLMDSQAPHVHVDGVPTDDAVFAQPDEQRAHKKEKKHKKDKKSKKSKKDRKSKKTKRDKAIAFLDIAAESGDDDDDDDEAEDGYNSLAAAALADTNDARPAARSRLDELPSDDDEINRYYEEQAAQADNEDDEFGAPQMSFAPNLLPRDTDPKIFAVKCRPGFGKILVARIVQKCYQYRIGRNHEGKKIDLGVISVFCLDHVKEYIYVEAHRQLFVERALNGIDGVFRFKISQVQPADVMQMMERQPENDKVRVGSFVRLRQRQYRMDLAEVIKVDTDGLHVKCRVVPREDFVGKPYHKTTTRLPSRFFSPSLAVGASDLGDHYRWGDLQFDKDGYLLINVSCRNTIFGAQMQPPTTEELAQFYNNDREQVRQAIMKVSNSNKTPDIRIGDTVRIVSGQLRNTVGTVVSLSTLDRTATLSCQVPGQKQPLQFKAELSICAKHFPKGTHVIVESGEFSGESGTVVKCNDDLIVLFPDRATGSAEIIVRAQDCYQSKLVSTASHTHGSWHFLDLVMLADTNVPACILRLGTNDVEILNDRNEIQSVVYAQIKQPVQGVRRQAFDRLQNVLTRGSEVIIEDTLVTPSGLAGETGRIEQVYNRTLFVYCRKVRTNSASIVALDVSCVLLALGRKTSHQAGPPRQLPAPLRRPHHATMGSVGHQTSEDWHSSSNWDETSTV